MGEYTFISQLGRSVTDYVLVSHGLISKLTAFRIDTELISSLMPLLVILGNVL